MRMGTMHTELKPPSKLEQGSLSLQAGSNDGHTLGLRHSILSPVETLAQSIAGIAPSAAPAMTLSLVFALAGNASWLAYLVATCAVVLTAININVFSSRSASAGSLYTYAQQGAGQMLGMVCGWSTVLAYVVGVCATAVQFSIFADQAQLALFHGSVPFVIPVIGCLVLCSFIAYQNIKLSAELMLWLEIASISVICLLCVFVGIKHNWTIDASQFALNGISSEGFRLGLVLAMLAFIGFESAGSLGEEAKAPLKDIPRALLLSTVLSGLFFVITAYAIVYGFKSSPVPLGQCSAPLVLLSKQLGFPLLAAFTIFGAAVSFFAACLAALNAGARVMLAMAGDKYFPRIFTSIHKTNKTPQPCIMFIAGIGGLVALLLLATKHSVMDITAWAGTIATYALIFPYTVIAAAAPFLLLREGKLRIKHIIMSALSVVAMGGVFIGSFLPLPAAPYCWFPLIFVLYLIAGALWYKQCQHKSAAEK
jgi:amino acid transporter